MEHLDTTFSPSSQEHQEETLCLGVKIQVCPQNGGKRAFFSLHLNITFGRVVEVEVLLRVEFRQGDSSAVWGQLQGGEMK